MTCALAGVPPTDSDCSEACEDMPECLTCHRTKKPRGRDAPLSSSYCDSDCPGYLDVPRSGHLWPGELARSRTEDNDDG